jgi:hypothetical protein
MDPIAIFFGCLGIGLLMMQMADDYRASKMPIVTPAPVENKEW